MLELCHAYEHDRDIWNTKWIIDVCFLFYFFIMQGKAINAHTRDEIIAPHVIPHSIHRLTFRKDDKCDPKILVVPSRLMQLPVIDGILSTQGSTMSVTGMRSNMCIRHASKLRLQNSKTALGGQRWDQ